jgi:GDPmannose 4,6-dehydratase
MKKAMVSGVTGQTGSYLAEHLLDQGYEVIGLHRRTSNANTNRLSNLLYQENFQLIECEVSDSGSVYTVVDQYKPDEIYNLAAMSHVKTSFEQPDYTFQVDALGPLHFLEAIRRFSPNTKFYQASTSELFGSNYEVDKEGKSYQDEDTPFMPQSPYAVAKLAAHNLVRIYRDGYGVFACAGVLFNHDGPRRGEEFVTRKITKWLSEFVHWARRTKHPAYELSLCFNEDNILIRADKEYSFPKLRLGNLDAYRDWGHASDYARAMILMLQQELPDDFVIATGETHSIREFLQEAFSHLDIENYEDYIVIDPKFYRPAEVEYLCGRADKAKRVLGWSSTTTFKQLVSQMVWSDINGKETQSEEEIKLLQEKTKFIQRFSGSCL